MWETLVGWSGWGTVGVGLAWIVTICLLLAGLVGCFLPILPGHLILLIAAIGHRLMLGREGSGLEWWSFVILAVLMAASQAFEFFSGSAGSKWFGGTRWGALGAFIGSIVGMFFLQFGGLLLGPLIGALVFELGIARKGWKPATVSSVGSVVGTVAGLVVKLVIGLMMIVWFFADVFLIK